VASSCLFVTVCFLQTRDKPKFTSCIFSILLKTKEIECMKLLQGRRLTLQAAKSDSQRSLANQSQALQIIYQPCVTNRAF